MLNKKFILVLTLCRKNKLRMISKATIVQFIEHKLLQPSLYVYKLCKKTQGLFSFDRFVFINQKYWYSENYIFFTQYIHFLLAEGNFNVLWCNWWLCFTCQSGCNRTSYNTGTKITGRSGSISTLIHVSKRQTLSHSFTQSFTLYKLSGERRLRKLFFTSFIENDADREAPDLVCWSLNISKIKTWSSQSKYHSVNLLF